MSLLAILAAQSAKPSATPPSEPLPPAPIPSSSPYNVDAFITGITDPYGHGGSIVHNDVLDFGTQKWRGRRYWMAATPYYNKTFREENPSIWHSDDPFSWTEVPSNPVIAAPTNTGQWNSDPHLAHDEAADQLVMVYRGGDFGWMVTRSSDGVNWATPSAISPMPGVTGELVSPVLERVGGQWALWGIQHPSRIMYRWTSPSIEGPWSAPVQCAGWNTDSWHFNIVNAGTKLLCLMNEGWTTGTAYAASSTDGGISWVKNGVPVLTTGSARSGEWDSSELYRGAIAMHDDGSRLRCWYPAYGAGSDSWRLGYTEIPLSEWP